MPSEDSNFVQWLPLCERMAIFFHYLFSLLFPTKCFFLYTIITFQNDRKYLIQDNQLMMIWCMNEILKFFYRKKKIDGAFSNITISFCCCIELSFSLSFICHSSFARHSTEVSVSYKHIDGINARILSTFNTTNRALHQSTHLLSHFC